MTRTVPTDTVSATFPKDFNDTLVRQINAIFWGLLNPSGARARIEASSLELRRRRVRTTETEGDGREITPIGHTDLFVGGWEALEAHFPWE